MSFSIFCLGNQISQITFEKCYQRYRVTNSKRGPHFIYCIGQTGSVKERVCNDDHKDSRRIRDKPMVNMRAECCSANLQLAPQWQFHACRTWFAGREERGSTITAMASAGPTHTACSLGTCVSCLPFVLHSPFPLYPHVGCLSFSLSHPYSRNSVPPDSVLSPSLIPLPFEVQCDIAEAFHPSREESACYPLLLLSPPSTPIPNVLSQLKRSWVFPCPTMTGALQSHFCFLFTLSYL